MPGIALNKLSIAGFKSICEPQDIELTNLNVLIGANGAGKSNLIEIFRLLRAMVDRNLQSYVNQHGGASDFFYNGPKQTPAIRANFQFGLNDYQFQLSSSAQETMLVADWMRYSDKDWKQITTNGTESNLQHHQDDTAIAYPHGVGWYVNQAITSWTVYHFHDTSNLAPMRRSEIIQDHAGLRPDAANIAPFLLHLRQDQPEHYQQIVDAIRLAIPFFDTFGLNAYTQGDKQLVKLDWLQKGSDYPMQPYHFSDGSIRLICLITALMQPVPPSTMVIDEPELGLHPYAIELLAELVQSTAESTQVIIATQSPALVDCFEPENIIVTNRVNGGSTFQRLKTDELATWLHDYTLGELWRKNIVAGGPVHE